MGPVSAEVQQGIIAHSPVAGVYEQEVNRESAYELLMARVTQEAPADAGGLWGTIASAAGLGRAAPPVQDDPSRPAPLPRVAKPRGRPPESLAVSITKSVVRSAGTQIGRQVVRGILGAMLKR